MSLESRATPLSIHLLRDGLTESVHQCQAVVVDERGRILAGEGGDAAVFARSALKPFQALAALSTGIREQYTLSNKDLALICGSHQGTMTHARQAFSILWRADLEPELLSCPVPEGKPSSLCHNCSGKHAAMLLSCRLQQWPLQDYADRNHPMQELVRSHLAEFLQMPADELLSARDDCGVPTYQVQLSHLAALYAQLTAGRRANLEILSRAMTAHPEMVSGEGRFDTEVMRLTEGSVVSKSGAEGIQCVGRAGHGMGLAIKVQDGASRAKYAAAIYLLRQMGWISPAVAETLSESFCQVGRYTRLEVEGDWQI
ncbi:MAG: asparaginase [Synechococcaceae cyanobacterium SM2_3_2]|nr:asparaginase [Synechococcaceae cyanobacterium SM2_3_2]